MRSIRSRFPRLVGVLAVAAASAPAVEPLLTLVPNLGQGPAEVRYADPAPASRFQVTAHGIRYRAASGTFIEQRWSDRELPVSGEDRQAASFSIRRGAQVSWLENIPVYRAVRMAGVAAGIDLLCYGAGTHLEYDLVVAPGADPGAAVSRFPGAELAIDGDGRLVVTVGTDRLAFLAPVAWQIDHTGQRVAVAVRYDLRPDGGLAFQVGDYDRGRELVIDPVLVMSTYLGGTAAESLPIIRVAGDGDVVVAIYTASYDVPISNPLYGTAQPEGDIYIARIHPDTGALRWATYLGGARSDTLSGMEVTPDGDVVVGATTLSPDMPVANAQQPAFVGGSFNGGAWLGTVYCTDAWVARIAGDGTALRWATYVGGSDNESIQGMDVGPDGSVVLSIDRMRPNIANYVLRSDFPFSSTASLGGITNAGSWWSTPKTNQSQALVKLTATGAMAFNRPIGGMGPVQVANDGRIFITGEIGPYIPGYGDLGTTNPEGSANNDPRPSITVFNSDLSVAFSSRYRIGGSLDRMRVSADGTHVIMTGYRAGSTPSSYMQTKNAYQGSGTGPTLVKFTQVANSTAYGFTFGTYFNPINSIGMNLWDVAFTETGRFALTGILSGTPNELINVFPKVNNLATPASGFAGYITEFDAATGKVISFSTLLPAGGIQSIARDPRPGVSRYAVAGTSNPTSEPLTPVNALPTNGAGSQDGFLMVIDTAVTLPTVTITAPDSTIGETAGQTATVTITRSGATTDPMAVELLQGGSADSTDLVPFPLTVTIPAGQASVSFTIAAVDDIAVESQETVILSITNGGVSYQLAGNSAVTLTLADNDVAGTKPLITMLPLSPAQLTSVEGETIYIPLDWPNYTNTDPDVFPITIQITGTAVPSTVIGGNDNDFRRIGTTQNFNWGDAYPYINVFDDSLVESVETITVTIMPSTAYDIGIPSVTFTITDNDLPPQTPTVIITAGQANGAEGGTTPTFVVTATNKAATASLQVLLGVPTGTATSGSDYETLPISVVMPPGVISATIPVAIIDDAVVENPEFLSLGLVANGIAYIIGTQATATVSIADNDVGQVLPTVAVTAIDDLAGEAGSDSGSIRLQRSGTTAGILVVQLAVGGSAQAGVDYLTLPTSATFAVGQSVVTLAVVPVDDAVLESPETVMVTVVAGGGYQVGVPSLATVTIADNESGGAGLPTVTLTVADGLMSESGSPLDLSRIILSRVGSSTAALTVDLVWSGTAVAADVLVGTLPAQAVIPVGLLSVELSFAATNDALVEGSVTLVASVAPSALYGIGGSGTGTITITDDDVGGANTQPVITQPLFPAVLAVTEDVAAPLTVSATDADGQTLTWTTTTPTKGVVTGHGTGLSRVLTYTPTANAHGADSFIITVTDSVGGSATRSVTVTISPVNDPPVNTALPAISGSATVGQVLSASTGQWNDLADGNPTVGSFAYQWRRSTAPVGGTVTTIAGATTATYTLTSGDVGGFMEVEVTATDSGLPGAASTAVVSARTGAVTVGGGNPGDTNGDLVVNAFDLNAVKAAFGTATGDAGFNPGADLNQDGIINAFDLNQVKANFGNMY